LVCELSEQKKRRHLSDWSLTFFRKRGREKNKKKQRVKIERERRRRKRIATSEMTTNFLQKNAKRNITEHEKRTNDNNKIKPFFVGCSIFFTHSPPFASKKFLEIEKRTASTSQTQ
jgi:hypothetical protein